MRRLRRSATDTTRRPSRWRLAAALAFLAAVSFGGVAEAHALGPLSGASGAPPFALAALVVLGMILTWRAD